MSNEQQKWFVWNPKGHQPRFVHDSYPSALAEAKRLARLNPGAKFYVLTVQAVAQTKDPVEVTEFDDIPF